MALSSRRQGCKLLSRTLKSLSGVVNDDLTGVERSAFSGLASRSVPQGSLGKALLRSFWAGSWKPLPARTYLGHQHEEYSSIIYPPTEAKVGKTAPDFSAPAIVDGEMETVSLKDYRGKYVILFFYPKDFTFVCPTEIIAFSDRAKEFEELNCQLIAASCDSEEVHLAWIKTPRSKGGLGHMQIPILADSTKEIAAKYGILIEEAGIALRGLFIINKEGGLEQITVNSAPIGRSVDEAKRLLQAIQFFEEHGEVCPADWQPGSASMKPDAEGSLDYFDSADSSKSESEDFGNKLESITSKEQFKKVTSSGKVVLDFYAPWCGKCRMLAPHLEKLQEEHPDIKFIKFDTTLEQLQDLGSELGVKALPNIRFLKDGQPAAMEVSGYKKKQVDSSLAELVSA